MNGFGLLLKAEEPSAMFLADEVDEVCRVVVAHVMNVGLVFTRTDQMRRVYHRKQPRVGPATERVAYLSKFGGAR